MTLRYFPGNPYWQFGDDDLIRYSVETVRGSTIVTMVYGDEDSFIDLPTGNTTHYRIYGGGGVDSINSLSSGNDHLYGGDGDDFIVDLYDGNDLLDGGNGKDFLSAGSGNDTLYGGEGKDALSGDQGDDLLWGGNGGDRFEFLVRESFDGVGRDVIFDFDSAADWLVVYARADHQPGGPHFGHPVAANGSADNYAEQDVAAGTSVASIEAMAQSNFSANSDIQFCFIADGTDGYLFMDIFDGPDSMVTLKGVGSVDEFSWNLIL
jgi:hypothetical protein